MSWQEVAVRPTPLTKSLSCVWLLPAVRVATPLKVSSLAMEVVGEINLPDISDWPNISDQLSICCHDNQITITHHDL